ncbi:hypothetical protein ILUMI_05190 [Ignelater luminosus]|uniref:DDE Tnp4 domain-containing protein n=1 Tax=Ignelater luminosus TaxID=2038154 RepID=A0A8K0DCT7_IGNLU|nr:hypothetical protein ILUMI_05190 [Ignelater luminosus]
MKTDTLLLEKWWDELTDEEFQDIFRMNKKTVIDLQAEIDYSENVYEDRTDPVLLTCLWYLGNTKPLEEAEELFNMKDIETAIQQYLLKILQLGSVYILWPALDEMKLIENGFAKEYKFPGVVGVIGSLHIETNASEQSDAELYYNEVMEKHSIILQVVCDSNCILRDVCVGCPGGKSIKEIFETSPLYAYVVGEDSVLSKNEFHLLGGTELPQLDSLLTPYKFISEERITEQQYQYNLLHESVMNVVEKTFRCLENRFPRLTTIEKPEFASLITSCVCVLHNFTLVHNDCCELYSM